MSVNGREVALHQCRVDLNPTVVAANVVDEAVLLDTAASTYFSLNEVGTRAWSAALKGQSVEQLYEQVLQEFDVAPAELLRDLGQFYGELERLGLATIRSA